MEVHRNGLKLLVVMALFANSGCGINQQQPYPPYGVPPQQFGQVPGQVPPFLPGGLPGASGGFQMPRILINGREFMFPVPGVPQVPQWGQTAGFTPNGAIPFSPQSGVTGVPGQPGAGSVIDPRTGQLVPAGFAQPGAIAGNQPQFMPAAPGNTAGFAPANGITPAGVPAAPSTGAVAPSANVASSLLGVQSGAEQIVQSQNAAWTQLQQNEQTTRAQRTQQQTAAQNAVQGQITTLTQQLASTTDANARTTIQNQLTAKQNELTTLRTTQQREVDQDTQTLTANRAQLKQQQTAQINTEITNLQGQMKAKQDEATQLRTTIQQNQAKDQELRGKITAKDQEMTTLTSTFNASEKTRTDQVTQQSTQLQNDLRNLQTQLSTATDATRASIQSQIDAKNRAITDLNTQSQQAYQTNYAKYQQDQQRITQEGQALRTELQTLINTNAPLPQRLADADATAQRLQQQIAAYQQRLTQIQNT